MLGLLGTLLSAGRRPDGPGGLGPGSAWGPAVAAALGPLTAGVALAILALVAYDGLAGRVEALANDLDRLGAETVDAIALTLSPEPRPGEHSVGPAGLGADAAPDPGRGPRGRSSHPSTRSAIDEPRPTSSRMPRPDRPSPRRMQSSSADA